jgi:hypothetical protein
MSQDEKTAVGEAKQRRSPISPIIPIDEAIEKARLIYAKDKRAFTDFKTLSEHIGYKVKYKGGTAGRMLSALKQYGLLDEKAGQFRISEMAWKILEMDESLEERTRLIKTAALRPPMIRKVLKIYDGELPSDSTLRNYLLFTEGFNTDSAANFIKVLRRTVELVKPYPADYNAGEESERAEQPKGAAPVSRQPPFTGQPSAEKQNAFNQGRPGSHADENYELVPLPGAQMQFTFYLSQTKRGTLSIPFAMTKKEWELLKKQIQSSLDVAEATALLEEESAPRKELPEDVLPLEDEGAA